MRSRVLCALTGLALAPLVIAGCASGSGTASDPAAAPPSQLAVAWLDEGRMVGIITWGSSCVPMADDISYETGALTVELIDPEDQPCTADYAPRTTLVGVEGGFDPSADLDISVTGVYAGSTMLAAAAGTAPDDGASAGMTDYRPSAGWYASDGFSLLTWGSSTCAPELEAAEATAATEVTVTFVTPPADRACTMDMAPRVLTVSLDASSLGDGQVEAILNGDEYRGVRVPIVGSR